MSRDLWYHHMHKEAAAYVLCYSDWAEREKPKQLFIGTVAVLPLLVGMWRGRLRMDMDAFGVGLGCAGCNIMHQLLWGPVELNFGEDHRWVLSDWRGWQLWIDIGIATIENAVCGHC